MKLYALRATWKETYDCPEEGRVDICVTHRDLRMAVTEEGKLIIEQQAVQLNRGHGVDSWTEERSKALRALDSEYDMYAGASYTVEDVTSLLWTLDERVVDTPQPIS